ncbi:hypothetical protein EJB05_45406 [Eragrostis curvula]|uniref:FBD domain-containing protein n=1 Tax=Eragrostis curvula TaxID=38414 RepID=A0A5J9TKH5_9POAL|nr:hypothetical protein EJB05_45406 [Eragrostis curvula]
MLQFPQLRELGLERVMISSGSLQSMIAGCPVLQCLLLRGTHGFNSLLISSPTLISIGVSVSSMELVIEDAPMLEKLLLLAPYADLHVSVISAPRLETLGCLYDRDYNFKLVFGTTVIEELRMVSFTKVVSSVKTLDINMHILSLNLIVDLMRCFPCLEKLYIQTSGEPRDNNSWHREHCDLPGCLDIHLKTVVLKNYRGTKSEATFAAFFIQNAKMLELMTFAGTDYNKMFIAQQKKLLKLNKRASSGARFHFTTSHFDRGLINNVHDLSVADPFKCTCCSVPPRC